MGIKSGGWRQSVPPIERYRLISIGISRAYHGPRWRALEAAVSDAEAVRDVLVSKYGFEVEAELHEARATRDAIVDALREYARSSRETDALVIYYAGHGHLDDLTNSGSWIPCDAAEGESRWVENDSIKKLIGAMTARHVLLLSDSCFSGDFFRGDRREFPGVSEATVELAAGRCAREAITSGGVEPVVDEGLGGKSPYAHWAVKALEDNEKEHLLASELFQRILGGVTLNAPQLPRYGPLFGTGGETDGQFVFRNHLYEGEENSSWDQVSQVSGVRRPLQPAFVNSSVDLTSGKPEKYGAHLNQFCPVAGLEVVFFPTPVRRSEFQQFAQTDPSIGRGWQDPKVQGIRISASPEDPVVMVTWWEASRYCEWLTQKELKVGHLQPGEIIRLPTSLEWEVAAGGGTGRKFPWGNEWPPPVTSGNFAGEATSKQFPHASFLKGYQNPHAYLSPVRSYQANEYGIHDLAGNVWEWCADDHSYRPGHKYVRGGSWLDGCDQRLIISAKVALESSRRAPTVGFRCVRTTPSSLK